MLAEVVGPVMAAVVWADSDDDDQISRCWRVLWVRQRERRGLRNMTIREVIDYDRRYDWRGDTERGGDVLGL